MLNLTYNEMLSAYDDYPAPISPYLLRAETHPLLREKLTKSFMRAFIDLLSRANIANPARPIWVRMDTTARRLGISAKTVSRTIALMTENAWLRPNEHHDGRNWQGKYTGREFILSAELRKIVGLPTDVAPLTLPSGQEAATDGSTGAISTDPAAEPSQPESGALVRSCNGVKKSEGAEEGSGTAVDKSASERTGMSDGLASFPQKPAENPGEQTKMSDGHIGVNNVFLKKEAFLKSEAFIIETQGEKTIRIPADLAEMHTVFGISGKGICGLMRLAKEKSQRLQDVWKAKKDQLGKAGATGGRAVLYLRRLLSCGKDFTYIARNMVPSPSATTEPMPASDAPVQRSHAFGERLDAREPSSESDLIDHLNLLEFGKTCAFRKFRHVSNGMTVRFYDGSADVSRGSTYEVYAGDMLVGLYRGVYRGNLIEVKE